MHKLIESAIEAANHGDKNKAMAFLKQVLTANPKDTEAMLVLAGLVDDPDHKRHVLNRLLTVDPVNLLARDELLKLDRPAMGAFLTETNAVALRSTAAKPSTASSNLPKSQTQNPAAGKSITQPVNVKNSFTRWNWVEESPTVKPQVAVEIDGHAIIEKPLIFKYPLFWRILIYFFAAVFGCIGLLIAWQSVVNSLPFLALAALMGLTAMAFSPVVEVSEAGIRASGMLSSAEIRWEEIATIRSMPMKRRLELSGTNGKPVNVSTQVRGYARLVEIIRQRRPDLFGGTPAQASLRASSSSHSSLNETRIFSKGLLKQYGTSFILIPFSFFAIWIAMTELQHRSGALIVAVICGILMVLPLFQVSSIKVEPDQLTIETLFEEKVLRAREIKEIKRQSVRGRYGRVSHFVNITLVTGQKYPVQGFSEGDEIIYGTLLSWWEFYQDE